MENDTSKVFENICTVAGAMLLAYPLIKQLSETMEPEMKKIASGQSLKEIPLLTEGKKESDDKDKEPSDSDKKFTEEIASLKKQLAEYEEKAKQSAGSEDK